MNIHKFIIEKDLNKLKTVSADDLVKLKIKLTECEGKIKSGELNPEMALELVIAS